MDKRMCHYYSGNRCDAEARAYSKRHRKIRLKARKLRSKARRASTTRRARNARRITKESLFAGVSTRRKTLREMTREEWLHALRHETDEDRRRELALPPLTLD